MKGAILLGLIFLLVPGSVLQDSRPALPVSVFKDLDGHWVGTFVSYDTNGKELDRIRVEQWYRTLDAHTQEVRVKDTMPGGKVITGRGKNIARKNAAGELSLECRVTKSNGEKVSHQGRVVRGPGGDKQIVWHSTAKDRTETFREWVVGTGKSKTYHIHGLGSYGGKLMLMAGQYRLQTE
ncbi:MAG: hypothetical protein V3U11_07745 [Planctomycetota bacterium]